MEIVEEVQEEVWQEVQQGEIMEVVIEAREVVKELVACCERRRWKN